MFFALFTILPFTVCLFWTLVFLLDWRRDNAAQHVLVGFMGTSAVLYLCHAVFFNHEASCQAVSECVYAYCNIAVFPLYYLYIRRLTTQRGLEKHQFAWLIPAVVIGLWTTTLHIFWPNDGTAEAIRTVAMRVVFMVQLVPICWMGFHKLRDFDNEIANYYADTEQRSVRQTKVLMCLLVGGALVSATVNFLGREYFDDSQLLIRLPSAFFSVLLFAVGYVGKRQQFCIDDLVREEEQRCIVAEKPDCPDLATEPEPATAPAISETSAPATDDTQNIMPSALITRFNTLMHEQHLYLRTDLRLSEVAAILAVSRTSLSQHINQELRLSFSDYVNTLRVEHACRLLADPANSKLSLTFLAEMSGFSSDSSFYRAFRRVTGKTPKQFMDESRQERSTD